MLLSERFQELTVALDLGRRADNEVLPHEGATLFVGCTIVVRRVLGRGVAVDGHWYNRLWELHTEASLLQLRSP
jgi:hypothetical protein